MEKQPKEQLTIDQILNCKHELIDRYSDGAAECITCGEELGPAGLILKHLVSSEMVDEKPDPPDNQDVRLAA